MLKALTAFFQAATAYLERWHLWKLARLEDQIAQIDDEIFSLALRGEPHDELRIERLAKRGKQLRALRSSFSNTDQG